MKWCDKVARGRRLYEKRFLVVDGYNVINAWPELKQLSQIKMEEARDQLIEWVIDYAAATGERAIVVFDAYSMKGKKPKEIEDRGILIVYTKENQTADSYIEIWVQKTLDKPGNMVRVVTSDWAEQQVVLGSGAIRLSPREMLEQFSHTRERIKQDYSSVTKVGNALEKHLSPDVLAAFDKWRKS